MILGSQGKKAVNIRYEEECNNISALVVEEEFETLIGILRLVLVAQVLLLEANRRVS